MENDAVGAPTGGMDQLASLRGEAGHVLFCDMRDLTSQSVPFDPAASGLAVLVVDTRAPHRHADGEYAARRGGCEEAARRLGVPALRDVTEADLDGALAELNDDELRRYVRHVVTEDARVLAAVEVLREGRVEDLGPLLSASHVSMRDDFRITVPEVDTAVDALHESGALGARMTGGGFGGCVIGLVPEGCSPRPATAYAVPLPRPASASRPCSPPRRRRGRGRFPRISGETEPHPRNFAREPPESPDIRGPSGSGRPVGGPRDRLDERLEQLRRQVVAHAVDQQQLGAGDRGGGGAATADVHHLVGRPVDDQRGHAQAAQPRGAVGLGQDRQHLAHHPAGADAAVEGGPGAGAAARRGRTGRPAEPISDHMASAALDVRVAAGLARGDEPGSSEGCCQPTVRRPVVELMLVSDRTRRGCSMATVWAIIPPIDTPDDVRRLQAEVVEQRDGVAGQVRHRVRRAGPAGRERLDQLVAA